MEPFITGLLHPPGKLGLSNNGYFFDYQSPPVCSFVLLFPWGLRQFEKSVSHTEHAPFRYRMNLGTPLPGRLSIATPSFMQFF